MAIGQQHAARGDAKRGAGKLDLGNLALALERQQRLAPQREQRPSVGAGLVAQQAFRLDVAKRPGALQERDRRGRVGDDAAGRGRALFELFEPFRGRRQRVPQFEPQLIQVGRLEGLLAGPREPARKLVEQLAAGLGLLPELDVGLVLLPDEIGQHRERDDDAEAEYAGRAQREVGQQVGGRAVDSRPSRFATRAGVIDRVVEHVAERTPQAVALVMQA